MFVLALLVFEPPSTPLQAMSITLTISGKVSCHTPRANFYPDYLLDGPSRMST